MAKKTTKEFKWSMFLLDIFTDVLVVVILVLLIRTFLFAPFRVHGPSMCDTFNIYDDECFNGDGEHIFTSRLSTWNIFHWSPVKLDRGDVIVFQSPYGEKGEYFIKRIIGLPGDTIKISNGLVYLMDEGGEFLLLDEDYLNEDNQGNTQAYRSRTEIYEVPEGHYFTLGDNRTRSSDSRRCFQQLGCDDDHSPYLPHKNVEGEVRAVFFPFSHARFIPSGELDI